MVFGSKPFLFLGWHLAWRHLNPLLCLQWWWGGWGSLYPPIFLFLHFFVFWTVLGQNWTEPGRNPKNPDRTWMELGRNPDRTRMEPRWNPDGTRMEPGRNPDGTRTEPEPGTDPKIILNSLGGSCENCDKRTVGNWWVTSHHQHQSWHCLL